MTDPMVFEKIQEQMAQNVVIFYMKGTPQVPRCGFSAQVVQILNNLGVSFKGVDVLVEPGLREGIKEFSQWPTIPQLYVKKEFIGGCDIVSQMYKAGELQTLFSNI